MKLLDGTQRTRVYCVAGEPQGRCGVCCAFECIISRGCWCARLCASVLLCTTKNPKGNYMVGTGRWVFYRSRITWRTTILSTVPKGAPFAQAGWGGRTGDHPPSGREVGKSPLASTRPFVSCSLLHAPENLHQGACLPFVVEMSTKEVRLFLASLFFLP